MKQKLLFLIFIIVLFSALQSCEDNFNPYGEYEKKYSLNCIIRGDTSLQIVTVFESFSPNENISEQNINNYFVNNASIRLWSGTEEIYYLRDTVVSVTDSIKINKFYYANILKPTKNAVLEIDALMPDGIRLKSTTVIPNQVVKDTSRTTKIISSQTTDKITFVWFPNSRDQMYSTDLSIYYYDLTGGHSVLKKIQIPWNYLNENGKEVPINMPPSKTPLIEYSMKNIEQTLKSIGENVNKENITILSAILELKVFDENLSTYYISSGRLFDNYSIRLDTKDFSNISGGYGIFGSFIVQKMPILFSNEYLSIFGYKQQN
jgi:hypothetical protein